jgi:hypothetical protein
MSFLNFLASSTSELVRKASITELKQNMRAIRPVIMPNKPRRTETLHFPKKILTAIARRKKEIDKTKYAIE